MSDHPLFRSAAYPAGDALRDWLDGTLTTQTQFALRLGVSQQAVSLWCTGGRPDAWHLREAIERITGGVVAARAWATPDELAVLEPVPDPSTPDHAA